MSHSFYSWMFIQENQNKKSIRDLYINVQSTFIYNGLKQKQHKCPSRGEWIHKPRYTYSGTAVTNKKKQTTIYTIWMNLRSILLSERNQVESIYHTNPFKKALGQAKTKLYQYLPGQGQGLYQLPRDTRKIWQITKIFSILVVVRTTQVYTLVKTHQLQS